MKIFGLRLYGKSFGTVYFVHFWLFVIKEYSNFWNEKFVKVSMTDKVTNYTNNIVCS